MFNHSISRFDLHHVADFLPYPFIIAEVIDGQHLNTFINESFKHEIGYSLEEIPTIEDWYLHAYPDPTYRDNVIKVWDEEENSSKKTGIILVRKISHVTCKNGNKKWYEIKASVVDGLHVVAFIDLDKEIKLQEELKNINSNNDRMLSVLGHDLRAPMANLIGITDLALDHDMSQEEFTTYIQLINQQSHQVLEMLETTLNWSRSNFNDIQVQPVKIEVNALIEAILTLYKNAYTAKNIIVHVDAEPSSILISDLEIVTIIVRNLLSNAIKFTPLNGTIHIQINPKNITITDTGVGMSAEQIASILNQTYTSTRGTANEIGMGMGLQLVQKLAEKIKAKLTIESQLKKGTAIQLTLE